MVGCCVTCVVLASGCLICLRFDNWIFIMVRWVAFALWLDLGLLGVT